MEFNDQKLSIDYGSLNARQKLLFKPPKTPKKEAVLTIISPNTKLYTTLSF